MFSHLSTFKQCLYTYIRDFLSSAVLLIICSSFVWAPTLVHAERFSAEHEEPEYVFGVFPFLPASRLEGTFAPLASELGQALGYKMHYRSASTYDKFMKRLGKGEFDIAFIQPFDYVRIAARAGYLPIAKRKEPLYAIFVVNKNSPVQSVRDLKGKTIAMAPEVAALSYLGKTALIKAGLDPERDVIVRHVRGHHSCLQQTVIGEASVCVTGFPALRVFEAKMEIKLRVLGKTPAIPQMLFVVHPRVPAKNREIIRQTLLTTTLSGVEPGLRTLLVKDDDKPFIPATDADYDIVRKYWKAVEKKR